MQLDMDNAAYIIGRLVLEKGVQIGQLEAALGAAQARIRELEAQLPTPPAADEAPAGPKLVKKG